MAWQLHTPPRPINRLSTMSDALEASLDLLRRLPPQKVSLNLEALQSLLPEDQTSELLASVDVPLSTRTCRQTGREYLLCDYNRDGDSYRSPWSGEWDPAIEDPILLSEGTRELEVKANDAFDSYRDLYRSPDARGCIGVWMGR